jgi:hypothetical protein
MYGEVAPEKRDAFLASSLFQSSLDDVGTAKKPKLMKIRKLVLALHDKYDSLIRHIETRAGRNPPAPGLPQPRAPKPKSEM